MKFSPFSIHCWLPRTVSLAVVCLFSGAAFAQPDYATRARPPEAIADLPFEKRVCRLYFDPVRPTAHDPLQGKSVPREPFYGITPEEVADIAAGTGCDLWSIGITWHGAWFPSKMVPQSTEVPYEPLKAMIDRAHEHGMWVFACQQLSDLENVPPNDELEKAKVHVIDDGRDIPLGPQFASYASDVFVDWMGRHMVEHVEIAGLDGFWFDGTPFGTRNAGPWPAGGVGPEAREKYKRDTGNDLPEKVDWNDPNFKRWVNWRYDVTVDCWDRVTAAVRQAAPHVVPIMNYYTRPDQPGFLLWNVGHPMRDISSSHWVAAMEIEGSMIDKVARALSPRSETWFWAHTDHVKEIAWGYLPNMNPDQIIAKGLRALAHGVVPCYGGFQVDIHMWKDAFTKVFHELGARRHHIAGDTVKYAAMVVSQQTRDFRQANDDIWHVAEGVTGIHNVTHLPLDVIFDDSLTFDGLSTYPIVIFDQISCLSDAQCDAIRRYVENGGTIIAMNETSLYDEWGNRRDNFGLADLFGVNYQSTEDAVTRVLVPHEDGLKEAFGQFMTFVSRGTRVSLRDGTDAEILMARSPLASVNLVNVAVDPIDSDEPEIVRRRVGKGSSIYCAADLADGYQRHRPPRLPALFSALERAAARPPIEFDAPARSAECRAHWHDENTLVAHIVNLTAEHAKFMAPLADIRIKLNGRSVQRANSPVTGRTFQVEDNTVVLPSVGYGEVVVMELD
jgi:hypothetical protein